MKNWTLWIFISLSTINGANAADCSTYQDKIHKLEDLRRHGGSLKQMERWRMQADELASKKAHCNNQNPIQIASGRTALPSSTKTKKISRRKDLGTTSAAIQTYDASEKDLNTSSTNLPILRSLKECIKPNNLIDNEVQECRQGLREPNWRP